MGAVLWGGNLALGPLWGGATQPLALALLVGLGLGAYAGLAVLTGAMRPAELRGALRRQR